MVRGIEAGDGFVGEEDRRRLRHGTGGEDAGLFAAGEFGDRAVRQRGDVHGLHRVRDDGEVIRRQRAEAAPGRATEADDIFHR
jgi:hypothetical protein